MSDARRVLITQESWPAPTAGEMPQLRYNVASPHVGMTLRQLVRAFKRRGKLILFMLVALNILAFAAITAVKPRYTAEATLLIGPRQEQVLDLKSVLAGLGGDSEAIESEVQLLRSRKVARAVVQQLQLDSRPEFVVPLKGSGLFANVSGELRTRWNQIASGLAPILSLPEPKAVAEDKPGRDPVSQATEVFQKRVGVSPRGHSRVVAVTFDSTDPDLAAAAANSVVETYIADQLRAKRNATASAHTWLEDRVAEMRQQVINADQQVAAYRHRAAITQGRTSTLLSEQISSLGEQAVQARVSRASADARLQALKIGGDGVRADGMPEVQASPIIQALRAQESVLQAQAAELSRTYGENHPKVSAARAAAAAVAGRISTATSAIAAGLLDTARTAQARDESLAKNLAALRQEVDIGTESEVELHALQHEAEANRALYDRLLARSRETNVEGGLQQPDAQVISKAEPPEIASFPNPAIILPIFFVASVIATVLLVFALEAMNGGLMTIEQVEQMIGVTALGLLPRVRGGRRGLGFLHARRPGLGDDSLAYAEAIRNLHTGLMLTTSASNGDRPKVVLVTSALPGEGKSTVVISLARMMAGCGKRVVIIDGDLHRPTLHRACGMAMGLGLVDYLTRGAPLQEILQSDRYSGAQIITVGSRASTAPDLFASDTMRILMESLRERFDLILLDSSPVLAVSDTRNISRLADTTMIVVRWRDTRREAVVAGLRQLLDAGGRIAGVLLTNVDLQQHAKHSDIGAYQRRIGLYLSE